MTGRARTRANLDPKRADLIEHAKTERPDSVDVFRIDLSAARNDEPMDITGFAITVVRTNANTDEVQFRLDTRRQQRTIPLRIGDRIEGAFTRIYITNTAQAGGFADIAITHTEESLFRYILRRPFNIATVSEVTEVDTILHHDRLQPPPGATLVRADAQLLSAGTTPVTLYTVPGGNTLYISHATLAGSGNVTVGGFFGLGIQGGQLIFYMPHMRYASTQGHGPIFVTSAFPTDPPAYTAGQAIQLFETTVSDTAEYTAQIKGWLE